jgi:L-alanine-DL-glutamate epimerase-like enolase superfamily enzyme
MNSPIAAVETRIIRYAVTGRFKFLATPAGPASPVVSRAAPTRDTVLVKVTDTAGRVGWGQCVPSHTWSYETLESVRTTIDGYLAPALVGLDPFDAPAIRQVLDHTIAPSFSTGQPLCKAGIDLALFDLTGRVLNQSAAERWGRRGQSQITLSWTVDVTALDHVGPSVAEAQSRGFRNFNVKVGRDAPFDLAVCREIRTLAPGAFVWVDANGGYDVDAALAVAPQFADLGLAAFEQPCPANRLSWYARLRGQRALPILMDEPIVSLVDLEEFHRLGLLDGVAMKVARCGGLTEARRMVEYLEQNGLLFFASGLTDPDLSLAASLLLFGAYQLATPAALNAPQFLSGTILSSPLTLVGDLATVPVGPGLGVDVAEWAWNNPNDLAG